MHFTNSKKNFDHPVIGSPESRLERGNAKSNEVKQLNKTEPIRKKYPMT